MFTLHLDPIRSALKHATNTAANILLNKCNLVLSIHSVLENSVLAATVCSQCRGENCCFCCLDDGPVHALTKWTKLRKILVAYYIKIPSAELTPSVFNKLLQYLTYSYKHCVKSRVGFC